MDDNELETPSREHTHGQMHAKEVAEKEGQVQDELLISRVAGRVGGSQVQREWDDLGDRGQHGREHLDELLIVHGGRVDVKATNLGQAFQGDVSKLGHRKEAVAEGVDDVRLEDVAQRDPVQKAQQRLQGRLDEARLIGRRQDLRAQLKDGRELGAHGRLEVLNLGCRHLVGRVVEDLLRQETKDGQVVLADGEAGAARRDNLVDERRPVVGPFLLEDRYQDEVELVDQYPVRLKALLGR